MSSTVLWSNPSPNQESDYRSGTEGGVSVLYLSQSIDNFQFIRIRFRPQLSGTFYNDAYIGDVYMPVSQFKLSLNTADSSGYYTPMVWFGILSSNDITCLKYKTGTTLEVRGNMVRYGAILNVYGCNFN